jgi:hypothetical protein
MQRDGGREQEAADQGAEGVHRHGGQPRLLHQEARPQGEGHGEGGRGHEGGAGPRSRCAEGGGAGGAQTPRGRRPTVSVPGVCQCVVCVCYLVGKGWSASLQHSPAVHPADSFATVGTASPTRALPSAPPARFSVCLVGSCLASQPACCRRRCVRRRRWPRCADCLFLDGWFTHQPVAVRAAAVVLLRLYLLGMCSSVPETLRSP